MYPSLRLERDHGVCARSTHGGKSCGSEGHTRQHQREAREDERVKRLHLVEDC